MLTRSEKRWLIYRKKGYCRIWCKPHCVCYYMPSKYCPTSASFDDYREAAEFEARVSAKLAINDTSYLPCHQKGHENQCPYDNYCPNDKKKTAWCKMKHARLNVEEEMDADEK